ncbi:MAG: UDP-N-acetylmuramate dehydrogenase [Planctomycetota bacterium]|nr:MAG: UDP-N-acetylmuramate dehydrogenase [Planctomycetota bacterium]
MASLDDFSVITRRDEPLAPLTWLRIGGPAQRLIEPRSVDELAAVLRTCHELGEHVRLLGGGSNLLIRDEGVAGVVIRLTDPAFCGVSISGNRVKAGGGALLSHVITESAQAGLAGMETLVGIPGTIAGALKGNAGGRNGEIGEHVASITVMTSSGDKYVRQGDELVFEYRRSNVVELCVVEAEFELTPDSPDEIAERMRKLWVIKKSTQPLSFQSAGCIFKNPRGLSAGALIEQAGLKGVKIGECEVSDRHGNFIVTNPGARSADVLKLIDVMRTKVSEAHGVELELEIQVW